MANFKQLEMAQALMSHNKLSVQSSLFGLKKSLVYTPTNSPLRVVRNIYGAEALAPLQRVAESDAAGLAAAVKACRLTKQEIGNVQLEACVSQDKQFVALQVLRFMDYANKPVTEPAFFEGEQAQLVAQLL